MAAQPIPIPRVTEPYAKTPYRQATWPSAARKVYACLMFYCYLWRIKDGRIVIADWVGSEWCSRRFEGDRYGSTGQRCWQKGLAQLEKLGVISRERGHGERTIIINVIHPTAKPKAPPKPKPATAKAPAPAPAPAPATTTRTAPAPTPAAEPPDDQPLGPEAQATWDRFRARAKAKAQANDKPRFTAEQAHAEMERRRAEARKHFGTDRQDGHRPARE